MNTDPRSQTPPLLTPEELSQQQAGVRRTGCVFTAVCVVLAVGAAAFILTRDPAQDDGATIDGPEGTVTYEVASRNHVTDAVRYPQTPPVGGDHNPTWWTCGIYSDPIVIEAGVHSLEHGAVWITYTPDLEPTQVDRVADLADATYILASPWGGDDLPAPIVLSAWGAQLQVDSLPDPRAEAFIRDFRQAATAPEPGALCTGGASG